MAAGAFGAHALRGLVTPERLATFETGARYALTHALALTALGLFLVARPDYAPALRAVAGLWISGIVLFAGSLWALVLLDLPVLGAVTPLGGVAMIAGWGLLAWRIGRAD